MKAEAKLKRLLKALVPVRAQIPAVTFNNDAWSITIELDRHQTQALVEAMDK